MQINQAHTFTTRNPGIQFNHCYLSFTVQLSQTDDPNLTEDALMGSFSEAMMQQLSQKDPQTQESVGKIMHTKAFQRGPNQSQIRCYFALSTKAEDCSGQKGKEFWRNFVNQVIPSELLIDEPTFVQLMAMGRQPAQIVEEQSYEQVFADY